MLLGVVSPVNSTDEIGPPHKSRFATEHPPPVANTMCKCRLCGAAEQMCIHLAHTVTRTTRETQSNASMVDNNDWRPCTACGGLMHQLSEPPDQRHTAHTPPHLQQARRRSSSVDRVVRARPSRHQGKQHHPAARACWRECNPPHDGLRAPHRVIPMADPHHRSQKTRSFARLTFCASSHRHPSSGDRSTSSASSQPLHQRVHTARGSTESSRAANSKSSCDPPRHQSRPNCNART